MTTMRSFAHCVRFKAILASYLCLGMGGCAMVRKLPNVKASSIDSSTAVLGVSVSATATGVSNTGKTLKAADASFKLSFPGFQHVTTLKDFEQRIMPEAPEKPATTQ